MSIIVMVLSVPIAYDNRNCHVLLMFQEIRLSLSVAGSTSVGHCYVVSRDVVSALYKRVHVNPHLLCASSVHTCNI